jgi:hypothetical protein
VRVRVQRSVKFKKWKREEKWKGTNLSQHTALSSQDEKKKFSY